MSIVVAMIDGNRTIIGSDTTAVCTSGRYNYVGEKWYEGKDNWWFGQIGDSRVADLVRSNIDDLTFSLDGPDEFVKRLVRLFEEDGRMRPQYPSDTTVPVWCAGGMLVKPGHIWELDSQLCLTPVDNRVLAARGAGFEAALGAAWALTLQTQLRPERIVGLAIQAVEAHNVHVRGNWTRIVQDLSPADAQKEYAKV